jgi:hypothetical protein
MLRGGLLASYRKQPPVAGTSTSREERAIEVTQKTFGLFTPVKKLAQIPLALSFRLANCSLIEVLFPITAAFHRNRCTSQCTVVRGSACHQRNHSNYASIVACRWLSIARGYPRSGSLCFRLDERTAQLSPAATIFTIEMSFLFQSHSSLRR